MSKYGSRKCKDSGFNFDSAVERDRYRHLALLEKSGVIENLELQPVYELHPAFERNGTKYRREVYKPDFRYRQGGTSIVEDVKGGVLTDLYKSKLKRLLSKEPDILFFEVYRKNKRWEMVEK